MANGGCDAAATCTDTAGSYTCSCNAGFTGSGGTCSDINECAARIDGVCDGSASCVNTVGSFVCSCNVGYSGNGLRCEDVNECQILGGGCAVSASCENNAGSWSCSCNAGYTGTGLECVSTSIARACGPGFYGPLGLEPCSVCAAGFYNDQHGAAECTACPEGRWTVTTGAAGPDRCLQKCPSGEHERNLFVFFLLGFPIKEA